METLLLKFTDMEKKTGLKLNEHPLQVVYWLVMYLHRHKDRFSCEISTFLGGDTLQKNIWNPIIKKFYWNKKGFLLF